MNGKMSQEPPSATAFPSLFCILAISPLTAAGSQVLMEREFLGLWRGSVAVAHPCCPGDEQKHQGLLENTGT